MKLRFFGLATLLVLGIAAPVMAKTPKVDICHRPPGNKMNFHIISVGEPALAAHLAHGDNAVAPETCDGIDNDCDGVVDNGVCICGNGVIEPPERCESDTDCGTGFECTQCACTPIVPTCGNGVIEPPEQCEADADCAAGFTCTQCACTPIVPICGNGMIEPPEQCEADADCGAGLACAQCTCVGTGDVRVTLTWSDTNDLDLHVIDPGGTEIYYGNMSSPSGGQLDVDANAACNNTTTTPVENIFWPAGGAPNGSYVVKVDYWTSCGTPESAFTVTTVVDGVTSTYSGVATTASQCGPCDASCTSCSTIVTFTR
ncbi:MAG TPA: MopE-related protein [Candidatus Dormibacteraeota bacterium]|nr:MopE-related protein [Candidatus Dormibacteraeota bacterium]